MCFSTFLENLVLNIWETDNRISRALGLPVHGLLNRLRDLFDFLFKNKTSKSKLLWLASRKRHTKGNGPHHFLSWHYFGKHICNGRKKARPLLPTGSQITQTNLQPTGPKSSWSLIAIFVSLWFHLDFPIHTLKINHFENVYLVKSLHRLRIQTKVIKGSRHIM